MFENYFKIAWRNLVKNKIHASINIIGLCAGLTCFTFISLWVGEELRYDKFNLNYDRIVRLVSSAKTETGIEESAVTSAPMAKALKDDYPEVDNVVRMQKREEIVHHNNQQVLQPGILLTDPSFFDVFSYRLSHGNTTTALLEPYSIILTESTAKKYFGSSNPMGQTLVINMYDSGFGATYTVTGVMPDAPVNAHFTFNMLASFKTIEVASPDVMTVDGWGDGSYYTYLLLREGVDHKAFSGKITHFYRNYVGERYQVWKSIYFYHLQELRDIHLRSNLKHEIEATGNINNVYIFSSIGVIILLLAGINYTNLATARAVGRAKEVGIKKVVGAVRLQLIFQYLAEAVLTALTALALSVLISFILQPVFEQVTGKAVSLGASSLLLGFLLTVTIFLGLLSGFYPALVISNFKPIGALKGSLEWSNKGILLRKTLVVSQFAMTIILITGIIVIYTQFSFIRNKDLGFRKESLLFLRVHGSTEVINGYEAFRNELQRSPLITGMATSNSIIGGGLSDGGAETVDSKGVPLQVNTARLRVNPDYLNIYGIKISAGRNFTSNASVNDSIVQIIINETAVSKFGWPGPESAIGKPFKIGGRQGLIIGVTADFHFNSLQKPIDPLAIYPQLPGFSRITVAMENETSKQAESLVRNTWKKHFPSALYDYNFLSQEIEQHYQSEKKFSQIFLSFSVLSLVIACLGLYGLISFTVFQKTKEIGIRKVLGASGQVVAVMLSGSLLKLILLACFISIPSAWYIMTRWLENFAYRTVLSWWIFAAACIVVLIIALATISSEAIKAAMAKPVKSLRAE